MTLRVCVIGNSHIVAIKQGWSLLGEAADGFSPTYFAAPGARITDLVVEDRKLVPGTEDTKTFLARSSEGMTAIDPAAFDAFILVGMHVLLFRIVKIYRKHRLIAHADARHQVISRAALDAAIYEDSVARLIGNLRGLTDAPIHLIPEPLPSENIIKTDEIWLGEYMPSLYEIYIEQLQKLVLAHRAELISQDADTIVHGAFTAAQYSIGAVGLYGKDYDRKEDFRHMNAQFGAELVNKSLMILRGGSAGTRE